MATVHDFAAFKARKAEQAVSAKEVKRIEKRARQTIKAVGALRMSVAAMVKRDAVRQKAKGAL